MAFLGRHRALHRTGLATLILLLIYFSQVYPYFHFHHDHADQSASSDSDTHTVNAVAHHAHHGHDHQHDAPDAGDSAADDHHHHPEFSQHIDWHLVRSQISNLLAEHHYGPVIDRLELDARPESSSWLTRIIQIDLPVSAPPADIDSRGPPTLA